MSTAENAAATSGLQGSTHASWLLGLALALLAYVLWHAFRWPAPVYLPELGTWALDVPEGRIGMRYYGWLLVGLTAFALGAGLGRVGPIARVLCDGRAARWLGGLVIVEVLGGIAYLAVAELSHWLG